MAGGGRKISWDLLRGGCVVLVMLYHSTHLSTLLHPELAARPLSFPYQLGASMLLVVSAYFVCVTIGRDSPLRYWWGRIARILPAFVAACVVIYLVERAVPITGWWYPQPRDLVANLLMFWHVKPQLYPYLDGSHWTVPVQLLGFTAATVLSTSRWGHGRRLRAVLWTAVVLPMLLWPIRMNYPPETYRMISDGLGMHRWHLFVAGVAVWMWSARKIGHSHFVALLIACLSAHALHNYTNGPAGPTGDWGSTVAVWIGVVVLALVARGPDWAAQLPDRARRAVTWFAGISYGVFLMHQSIGYLLLRVLQDHGFTPVEQTLAMLVTGTLLGWALTVLVERPARRWLMRPFARSAAPATQPAIPG